MSLTPSEKKALVLQMAGELPSQVVAAHMRGLDSDYFNEFEPEDILQHLKKIAALGNQSRFDLDLVEIAEGSFGLTIIGEDIPGFFAALTGLVASYDFDIRLGKVFTYAADPKNTRTALQGQTAGRKIIDYLVLDHRTPDPISVTAKPRFITDLEQLIELLRTHRTQELRHDLYRRIGSYLSRNAVGLETPRQPLEINIDYDDRQTLLTVRGTDRKALLFSLSNALMLQGVSIQKLLTKSEADLFEDRIFITDSEGRPISDMRTLERLKVAIVLMERFISTLPQASDYPAAIETFNVFIDSLVENSSALTELPTFQDFSVLSALAKVLGAGPYLWEELTKIPFRDLTDLLQNLEDGKRGRTRFEMEAELKKVMQQEKEYAERVAALNRFKDFQLFRLDVIYLVYPYKTLQEFSSELSELADVILDVGLWLAYDELSRVYGMPKALSSHPSQAGPCHFGLFAQGKLGGRELGYASDLELQLIYEHAGETTGTDQPISHAEFYSQLVKELRRIIVAKKEGIFELDLRLRPHGESGPMASRLDVWVEYYGEDGGALDYERQALLKLRPVSTTPSMADKIMAARDALVFGENKIGIGNTLALRAQQVETKTDSQAPNAKINAKYSLGGLVEVEYAVQFLQLQHGRRISSLREPNTEKALEVLLAEGILPPAEFEKLYKGYTLLRRLINALRMVRGHSRDLLIPSRGTPEFLHLAKRMGYLATAKYEPDSQLDWELRLTLKDVHALFARRFLSSTEPESDAFSLTSVFLNSDASKVDLDKALARLGITESNDSKTLITGLFASVKERGLLCAVLVVSEAKLRISPDPVAVLHNLGSFLDAVPDADYFVRQMLNHPHLQEILIKAFGHSEYLSQILLQRPDYLLSLGNPQALEKGKLAAEFRQEIKELIRKSAGQKPLGLEATLELLCGYRNGEYLRIGLRDIFLGEQLPKITSEISHLSNALVESVFERTMEEAGSMVWREAISVIALGKLGGNELNYSSDIDIVFVLDPNLADAAGQLALKEWARLFIASLSRSGTQGKMFRVDTQLRPYGSEGALIGSIDHYENYYRDSAAGWELQSWLKARPLTGNLNLGTSVTVRIQALAVSPAYREKIETSMRQVRKLGLEKLRQENRLSSEVKLGPGGIRTIEFYVQYLQILNGQAIPELISGNTLSVLNRLFRYRLISQNYFDLLTKSYVFLRRIEHVLQLQGLQQRHELPTLPEEMEKLAKRMGFEARIGQSASSQFRTRYRQHMLTLLELSSSLFGYATNIPNDASEAP